MLSLMINTGSLPSVIKNYTEAHYHYSCSTLYVGGRSKMAEE